MAAQRPLFATLAVVYLALIPIEALLYDPPAAYFVTAVNTLLTMVFAGLAVAARRGKVSARMAHPVLALVAVLALASVVDSFLVEPTFVFTVYVVLILVVFGSYSMFLRWIVAVSAVALVTWAPLVLTHSPAEDRLHHLLALFTGVAASVTVHVGRSRIVHRLRASVEESEKARARLEQAARLEALGRMAGGIAHDFNNMLAPILAVCELNLEEDDERHTLSRQVREDLETILASVERGRELSTQLLAVSRRQPLDARILDFDEVVRGAEPLLARVLREDVALIVRTPGDPVWVEGDNARLEEVLLHLTLNAMESMPAGGTLNVGLDRAERVRLQVRDTGERIPAAEVATLFEPFSKRKIGLSLATAHAIVTQHRGTIEAESSDDGTIITVSLPAAEAPHAAEVVESRSELHDPGGLVLVVEDEAPVRAMVGRILERHGYRVQMAAEPAEAIAWARSSSETIDLLLTDVIMPEMDGRQLHARLCELQADLPVVFMSGYPEDVLSSHEVTRYLQKPFPSETLLRVVAEALRIA